MWQKFLLLIPIGAFAAETIAPDRWLEGDFLYPRFVGPVVETNFFATVHAEAVADGLQVLWTPASGEANRTAGVVFSADAPGHWPARDWRTLEMGRFGATFKATVPIDSVQVPLVYFITCQADGGTNVSRMRLVAPRGLGLQHPSKYFWPFLEGFEQGTGSWRPIGSDESMRLSATAKNGKSSLSVRIPPLGSRAAVGTTRLRGWFAEEHQARGFTFWARAVAGSGEVRCSAFANAFTTNQVVSAQTNASRLTMKWQRVEVTFNELGAFPLNDLDFIAWEFTGPSGTEFLLDDVSMLGRWRFE